jgi:hypothetical protein
MAQLIMIDPILIAEGQAKHLLADHCRHPMLDLIL